jgi:hypothetical protein
MWRHVASDNAFLKRSTFKGIEIVSSQTIMSQLHTNVNLKKKDRNIFIETASASSLSLVCKSTYWPVTFEESYLQQSYSW